MFKGGVKEAAKMLSGLGPAAQRKILAEIRAKDPAMAEQLEKNLISMDDLQYLTAPMLVSLLRDVSLEDFGLALRTVNEELVSKLLGMAKKKRYLGMISIYLGITIRAIYYSLNSCCV